MHRPSQGIASAFTAWCDGPPSAVPLAGIPPAAFTAIDCLQEQTPSASLHKIAAEAVRATPDTKDKGGKNAALSEQKVLLTNLGKRYQPFKNNLMKIY